MFEVLGLLWLAALLIVMSGALAAVFLGFVEIAPVPVLPPPPSLPDAFRPPASPLRGPPAR